MHLFLMNNKTASISKCGDIRCFCCDYLYDKTQYTFKHTGYTFHLKSKMSCNSSNLIYVIICKILAFCSQFNDLIPNISLQPLWSSRNRTSNYHGKFGDVGVCGLDPSFEPYSAFIFETALFRTDNWYEEYLIPYSHGDSRNQCERFLNRHRN